MPGSVRLLVRGMHIELTPVGLLICKEMLDSETMGSTNAVRKVHVFASLTCGDG